MLLALLVITQAAAEWVEISQQHYRKPIRTHSSFNPFTTPDKFEVEETTKSWIYNNRSVSEYNWNKASIRQPNVKRVQYPATSVKPTESVRVVEEYTDLDKDEFELQSKDPTKPTMEFKDNIKQKGTITRVPNIGNVKRVQLNSTPVKSPLLNVEDKEKKAKTRYEELPLENEREPEELFQHKRRSDSKVNNRRIYINEINQYSTEPISIFPTEDESSSTEEVLKQRPKLEFKNRTNIKNILLPKPTFITETEDFIKDEKYDDKFYKITLNTKPRVTEKKHIFTPEVTAIDEDVIKNSEEIPKQTTKQNYKTSDLIKQQAVNKLSQTDFDTYQEEIVNNDQRKHKKDNKADLEQERRPEKEVPPSKKVIPDKENKDTSKGNKSDNKVNNMENLVKLMKVVADTISQNSRRSFGGKMRYLHDLKDTILANIAERIDATWPDDGATGPHRRSRSAHARGHHVHFPSSESALMTISFLTFAVFLIKLVLQVIHTYKNKTMMVAPVMVAAAGRAAHALRGNH